MRIRTIALATLWTTAVIVAGLAGLWLHATFSQFTTTIEGMIP